MIILGSVLFALGIIVGAIYWNNATSKTNMQIMRNRAVGNFYSSSSISQNPGVASLPPQALEEIQQELIEEIGSLPIDSVDLPELVNKKLDVKVEEMRQKEKELAYKEALSNAPICPKCETRRIMLDDYLCRECRG